MLMLACSLLCLTILRPWRWRRYVPPKRRVPLNALQGVISHSKPPLWKPQILLNKTVSEDNMTTKYFRTLHTRVLCRSYLKFARPSLSYSNNRKLRRKNVDMASKSMTFMLSFMRIRQWGVLIRRDRHTDITPPAYVS
jgi:hypothetical protein